MPDAGERRYLVTAGQVRAASALGLIGMGGLLLAILLLPALRPQAAFVPRPTDAHALLLEGAQAKLSGFEVGEGGAARIDIDHAIRLVVERGVDLPLVAGGVAPADGVVGDAPPAIDAAEAYRVTCGACHQAAGGGLPGAFPPLAGHVGDLYRADRAQLPLTVLFGIAGPIEVQGVTYDGLMPALARLSDEELATLANHVMTAWGDDAEAGDGFEPYLAEEFAAWRALGLTMADVHARRVELTLR